MPCRYVLRLYRLAAFHVKHGGSLSATVLAQHARRALAHLDECALVASVFEVQFVEILAKGDVRGAYTFCDGFPRSPEEDDLGAGCRCFGCRDAHWRDRPADGLPGSEWRSTAPRSHGDADEGAALRAGLRGSDLPD